MSAPLQTPPLLPGDFEQLFRRATGAPPHSWQRALARELPPPSVIAIPTGAGKTAGVILAWILHALVEGRAPRRLVYALPMRTLVEQTYDVAAGIRERLGLTDEQIAIHVLMGGEPRAGDGGRHGEWRESPERPQILVGTIDMLLSRALCRGYGEGRFAWPIAFGLLNDDCWWVLDEVQLMGPARATTAQLDAFRRSMGTLRPTWTTWMSATVDPVALTTVDRPELGPVLSLEPEDQAGELGDRMSARKLARRLAVAGGAAKGVARATLEDHRAGTRSLLVVNTVRRAQEMDSALRKAASKRPDAPRVVLLHSRFRPGDRVRKLSEALSEPEDAGTIVVATQVIEAGVDVSSALLVSDLAPWSSLVQRLGRLNRAAEHDEAVLRWIDPGDNALAKVSGPYEADDLGGSREQLLACEGESLSPRRLREIHVEELRVTPLVLRRRDLLELFDTAPDISGLDVDIEPFVRPRDESSVEAFFRGVKPGQRVVSGDEQSPPAPQEVVAVPRGDLAGKGYARRAIWVLDHVAGDWVSHAIAEVRPGEAVLLAASQGGYHPDRGWTPKSSQTVEVLAASAARSERLGDDARAQHGGTWVSLADHLASVEMAAAEIARELGLDGLGDVLRRAGALHDLGKAHRAFQSLLRSSAHEGDPLPPEGSLAKSPKGSGGSRERPHLRHELASALALADPAVAAAAGVGEDTDSHLLRYLVAAHHGRVRLSIRPAPGEELPARVAAGARFALGVVDGDELPAQYTPLGPLPGCRLELAAMEPGGPGSWSAMTTALRDDPELGPFRLAALEALLRIADWRGSRG